MSHIVCFLALVNLFNGQDAIGDTVYFISNLNMKTQIFFSVLLCLVFIFVKLFLRFKNERVGHGYNIMVEMLQNDKPIRNFFQFACVSGVVEISTCYFINKSFETNYELSFKEVVGFVTIPLVIRTGITHVMKPTRFQWFNGFNNAIVKVENDKKTRNKRSIIVLVANKYDVESRNKIKDLPVELIRILNKFLE